MIDDGKPDAPCAAIPASAAEPARFEIVTERLVRRVFGVCVTVEIALFLADALINYASWSSASEIQRMFNGTREDSVLSWFSATQTFITALTLLAIYAVVRRQQVPKWRRRAWLVVALFFCYMAFDDGVLLHERIGSSVGDFFEAQQAGGEPVGLVATIFDYFPSYYWQLIFLPFFGAMGLFVLVFLWRELRQRRPRVLVSVAIALFVVAVGLDFVEGLEPEDDWNVYTRIAAAVDMRVLTQAWFDETPYDALVHFSKTFEEVLETLGNTILLCVFLRHLGRRAGEIRVRFD